MLAETIVSVTHLTLKREQQKEKLEGTIYFVRFACDLLSRGSYSEGLILRVAIMGDGTVRCVDLLKLPSSTGCLYKGLGHQPFLSS